MTQEQAKAIFDKQVATGALVGFVAGDTLSSATQVAAGLSSAAASLAQQISGVQNFSSLGYTNPSQSVSTSTPGSFTVTSIAGLTAAAAALIGKRLISTSITDPLTISEYAKATPANLATVGNLTIAEITAAMAAVEKLSGQSPTDVTDAGIGKYALSCQQLERTGYIKSGTADKFLSQDQNTLISVLESSAVWTGKSGVKSLAGIVDNTVLQTQIQQDLMTTGVQQIIQVGIDVSKMTSAVAGAIAVNAAKNVADTVAWVKNLPLPANTLATLNQLGRAASFAINLAAGSLNDATKRVTPEVPAIDTVDRKTLNAASLRVVGNSKVPTVLPKINSLSQTSAQELLTYVNEYEAVLISVRDRLLSYRISSTVTQDQFDALNEEYLLVKTDFSSKFARLLLLAQQAIDVDSNSTDAQQTVAVALNKSQTTITELSNEINKLLALVLQILVKLP